MPIYKQTTEITNIDDLLSSVERDIEDVYFGDKHIFSVWGEYDGTFPAQYNANGDYLADYRIYGAAGGVGDDSGTAYGYEVDMATKSRNVMPSAAAEAKTKNGVTISCDGEGRYYILGTATVQTFIEFDISMFTIPISVGAGGNGTFSMFNNFGNRHIALFFYNSDYAIDSWICSPANRTHTAYNLMSNKVCNKIKFQIDEGVSMNDIIAPMFTEDGTLPTIYQPYSKTVTPIYIGSSPLGEDEYVSFKEQKIYRMSGGVLTPTDPPVPLPALPTVDGTNIVDYAGQSAAVPERFVAKYRKERF